LLGFIAGGVGIAALAAGAGFAYSASSTASSLKDVCGPERSQCPASEQGEIDRLKTHALAADLFLAGGGVFVVGGAALVLTETAPKKEPPRVRLSPIAFPRSPRSGHPAIAAADGGGAILRGTF
jgi:hypothetical protein